VLASTKYGLPDTAEHADERSVQARRHLALAFARADARPPQIQAVRSAGALLATINIGVVLMPLAEILHWKRHNILAEILDWKRHTLHDAAKRTYSQAKRASYGSVRPLAGTTNPAAFDDAEPIKREPQDDG
jgi:hypothetical protein